MWTFWSTSIFITLARPRYLLRSKTTIMLLAKSLLCQTLPCIWYAHTESFSSAQRQLTIISPQDGIIIHNPVSNPTFIGLGTSGLLCFVFLVLASPVEVRQATVTKHGPSEPGAPSRAPLTLCTKCNAWYLERSTGESHKVYRHY